MRNFMRKRIVTRLSFKKASWLQTFYRYRVSNYTVITDICSWYTRTVTDGGPFKSPSAKRFWHKTDYLGHQKGFASKCLINYKYYLFSSLIVMILIYAKYLILKSDIMV